MIDHLRLLYQNKFMTALCRWKMMSDDNDDVSAIQQPADKLSEFRNNNVCKFVIYYIALWCVRIM
jgi:hypothetical protein